MCPCRRPASDDNYLRAPYLTGFVVFVEHMATYLIACIAFVTAKSAAGRTATTTEAKVIDTSGNFR